MLFYGLPLLHIAVCVMHLRGTTIVVFKVPVEHCRIREAPCFQPSDKFVVLLLTNSDFLLLSLHLTAPAIYGMPVLSHQDKVLCKERFFWRMTFSAIKQAVFAIIVPVRFGNRGNDLF